MKLIRSVLRRLRRPRPAEPEPYRAQIDFLREARLELQSSYPRVRPWAILRLLRHHGLRRFPDGLLLEARPVEAFWMLLRVALARHVGIDWHPLFSEPFYLVSNPDLADLGVSPWLHYQVFGRAEGRTPHPLIDVGRLAVSMPGVRRSELVDEYFANPARWLIDPSSYVDAQAFALTGPWNGATHPLKEIVSLHTTGPWMHSRLMVVDSADDAASQSRLVAAGALLVLAGGSSRVATMKAWSGPHAHGPSSARNYTVVPGYFLGAGSAEIASDAVGTLSPDSSMIRHSTGFVSIVRGPEVAADTLIYLEGELPREELERFVQRSTGATVIAPGTAAQESALKSLRAEYRAAGITVLEHGVQAHVACKSSAEVLRPVKELMAIPIWEWETGSERDIVVVVSHRRQQWAGPDEQVRALIEAGAALCLIEGHELEPWLPLLNSRSRVVVERSLIGLVAGVVNRASLFELPGSEASTEHE